MNFLTKGSSSLMKESSDPSLLESNIIKTDSEGFFKYLTKISLLSLFKDSILFIRTTLLINASEWKALNSSFRILKEKFEIPIHQEIKWANLWSLKIIQNRGKKIPRKHDLKPLENFDYHNLINFVEECLSLIENLQDKKIIATYTRNSNAYFITGHFLVSRAKKL